MVDYSLVNSYGIYTATSQNVYAYSDISSLNTYEMGSQATDFDESLSERGENDPAHV